MRPIRHRNRKINTCLECRRLKRKCSKTHPCTNCEKTDRDCVFPESLTRGSGSPSSTPTSDGNQTIHSDAGGIIHQATSGPTGAPTSEPVPWRKPPDICLRIGKLSITERIGGVNRTDIVSLFNDILEGSGHQSISAGNQLSAPVVAWFKPHTKLPLERLLCSIQVDDLNCDENMHIPDVYQSVLVERFFIAVRPVCHAVCREDLDAVDHITTALRLCMIYAAAVSLPVIDSLRLFGIPKDPLVKKVKTAAENALCSIGVFETVDVKLFQALLIYLTPQLLSEVSRSHTIFLSAVTRHFQISGYDRHLESDLPRQVHLKRSLWQHLLFLNIRATEAVGPETALIDDQTSKMPNFNILADGCGDYSSRDSIITLVRYECYRVHRRIFLLRELMKSGEVSPECALQEIDSLVIRVEQTYLQNLDPDIHVEKYAKIIGTLLLSRAICMIRYPLWGNFDPSSTSIDVRNRSVTAMLDLMEAALTLETDPDLAVWSWYAGAYQQYHSILPMLCFVYLDPNISDAERVMAIVDHIFGQSSASRSSRAAEILQSVRDNVASFLSVINPVIQTSARIYHALDMLHDGNLMVDPTNNPVGEVDSGRFEDLNQLQEIQSSEGFWYPWPSWDGDFQS